MTQEVRIRLGKGPLPLSTSDATQEVRIRLGKDGPAAAAPTTIMQKWDEAVEKRGDKPALFHKQNGSNEYTSYTWKEYRAKIDAFGKALISLGLNKFDTINIIGFNSPEWFWANYGAISIGGIAAGIYSTNNPEACKYIADHSKAKVIVCRGLEQLEKFSTIAKDLPNIKAFVVYGLEELPSDIKQKWSVPVYTFDDFLTTGEDVTDETLKARSDSSKPGETCALIYTSGTTGPPKAAMITHDNITWTVSTWMATAKPVVLDHNDVVVSYLPLSHIAGQMLDMYIPLQTGVQVYLAQPDALKGSLGQTLKEARPTFFFGVPRVWEKFYEKLQQVGKTTTGLKKVLSTWAKQESAAYWESQSFGSTTKAPLFYFASKAILNKVHVALGLDRCRFFFTGAAPVDVKILKYFASINMPITEVFGQSECSGIHCVGLPHAFKLETVGRPILGTESKTDSDTGELCYRGRHIFAGYLGMPDKTQETIDEEGWLHSGDVVKFDGDNHPDIPAPSGFMTITGRIKELIITAGGENIAPVLIESEIKDALPCLSNAIVIGDKRKFLTALFCLQVEIDEEGVPTNKLTGQALDVSNLIGSDAMTSDEARECSKWKAFLDEGVQKANGKAISRAHNVGKWSLLSGDLSEKGGELTPTLKLKRSTTAEKYQSVIDAMYA